MSSQVSKVLSSKKKGKETESQWLPVSDLMAGLMMVFMFISIALMRDAMIERDKIKEVAVTYQETQQAIYEALLVEFESDLKAWGAEVNRTSLSFDFNSPEVLFASGKSSLTPKFKNILDEFFPRYVTVLDRFKENVDEVRIEGHTSSQWHGVTEDEAYFSNMQLSQSRTRSVLDYMFNIENVTEKGTKDSMMHIYPWLKGCFVAIGFSSAKLKYDASGKEDAAASRRVSFRILTNAETQIRTIIEN